ncbi:hypothetical protein BOX15_Mlig031392g2 [Macrostomum lignano]|uniref:CW-type domain-containing protein n=1 Tax=Macrostomum lignano TaxID=282301 RepID=A0A267DG83_9PLAT|nr:hypothetical protein BOX15_Mlig031392g2 [Macrostomum lignano]
MADNNNNQPGSVQGLRSARTSPAYLMTNSTSHSWVFSAIAELVDNAYDPDCQADNLNIGHYVSNGMDVLSVTDDGLGMTTEQLHNMLSFGYCFKVGQRGHKPIGHYGNGFKSGSMRIGKDALVFTKRWSADGARMLKSVGMLSQTFLAAVGADTVVLPIASWLDESLDVDNADSDQSLALMMEHCPLFNGNLDRLLQEFDVIPVTGTRILIYNLKRCSEDPEAGLELDFETDRSDIICSETVSAAALNPAQRLQMHNLPPVPHTRRSLRAYLAILYLQPRMSIRINAEPVQSQPLQRLLTRQTLEYYSPKLSATEEARLEQRGNYRCRMLIGFLPDGHGDYGALLYHHNRLILAYEKLIKEPGRARGVALVAEVDHLQPNHIKQDFERNQHLRNCMARLTHHLREFLERNGRSEAGGSQTAGWQWLECSRCGKSRRLPSSGPSSRSLDKRVWHCALNPDAFFNTCGDPEETGKDEASRQLRAARDASLAADRRQSAAAASRSKRRRTEPLVAADAKLEQLAASLSNSSKLQRIGQSLSSIGNNGETSTSAEASVGCSGSSCGGSARSLSVKLEPAQPDDAAPDSLAATAEQQLSRLRSDVLLLLRRLLPKDTRLPLPANADCSVDAAVASVLRNLAANESDSDNDSEKDCDSLCQSDVGSP